MKYTSRRLLNQRLMASLAIESAEVVVNEAPLDIPENECSSAEAIETIGDIQNAELEQAKFDELDQINERGEELVVAVEAAVESGKGLNPLEAAALRLTMKQVTGKYAPSAELLVPAREAFGGTADAMDTSKEALSGIKGAFSSFLEATKAQFLKAIKALQDLFRSIVSRFQSVSRRAQSVVERAKELSGEKSATIVTNVTDITIDGKVEGDTLYKGLGNVHQVLETLLRVVRNNDEQSTVTGAVNAVKEESGWKTYVDTVNSNAKRTFDSIPKDASGEKTVLLPGERVIQFVEGEPGTANQFSREELVRVGPDGKLVKTIVALAKTEIIECATIVIEISKVVEEYNKVWTRGVSKATRLVQGISQAVKGDIGKLEQSVEGEDDETRNARSGRLGEFKLNVSALFAHFRALEKFNAELVTYSQAVSISTLVACERSLLVHEFDGGDTSATPPATV